jgi:hypothetical protein
MASWKIVKRIGGTVSTHSPMDIGLGKSSHDSFMQLINSSEFISGVTE